MNNVEISETAVAVNNTIPSGVDEALQLARFGWAVFPLNPETGRPYSNEAVASALGMQSPPAGKGGCYLARTDTEPVRKMWAAFPNAEIGIATGKASGLYVLDIDRKNGKDGFAALAAKNWKPTATFWVNTKSGGQHHFYSIPTDAQHYPSDGNLGPGIDRKGDGGYVRWYGSAFGSSGRVPLAPTPMFMLSNRTAGQSGRQPLGSMPAPSLEIAQQALYSVDPNDIGRDEWRDVTAAFRQAGTGLTEDAMLRMIWDGWCVEYVGNDKAENETLWRSFNNGTSLGWDYLLSKAAPEIQAAITFGGVDRSVDVPAVIDQPDRMNLLATFHQADAAKNSAALCTAQLMDIQLPVAHNEFSNKTMIMAKVPWDDNSAEYPREWNGENDDTHGCKILLETMFVKPSKETVFDSVQFIAKRNKYHPVRDYLNKAQWDGIERLDTVLPIYFGTIDTAYARLIGAKFLISAVARIMQPGCKVDTMLILESSQGKRKSAALRALVGDEWFTDQLPELSSKDASIQLRGKWIIEVCELDAMSRAEVRTVKQYVARQIDTFRPVFGRATVDIKRQSVFAGSTNETEYLRDQTGNRRYWPIECGLVDIEALERDRDHLWAEALIRYRQGELWYLEGDAEQIALVEQENRRECDPWENRISKFCASMGDWPIAVETICLGALDIPFERHNATVNTRIKQCLKHAGYERKQIRDGNERAWKYVKKSMNV